VNTAMPWWQAVVLGLVQGLSEFLPISSSGHLRLVPWAFGWESLSESHRRAFDVALHFGTLIAVVAYFRNDLRRYVVDGLSALGRRPASADGRLAWYFVVSALPAAVIGFVLESRFDDWFGDPGPIAVSLIVFGLLLLWADTRGRRDRELDSVGLRDALLIGFAQVLALNPGTSRSGITITAGRLLGLRREAAARFAFVMGIPVIAGAFAFEMLGLVSDGIPDGLLSTMAIGVVTAGASGWLAVWGTLRLVTTRTFAPFVVYRCLLGAVVLVALAF